MSVICRDFSVIEEESAFDIFEGSHAVSDDVGSAVRGESFQGILDEAVEDTGFLKLDRPYDISRSSLEHKVTSQQSYHVVEY